MKHFKKLPMTFDVDKLQHALKQVTDIVDFPKVLIEQKPLKEPIYIHGDKVYYQLCLTRRNQEPAPDCYYVYRGDHKKASNVKAYAMDKIHINTEKDEYHKEFEYTEFIPELSHTYFKEVYDTLTEYCNKNNFILGRARLRLSYPLCCLEWHQDDQANLHIPIVTSPGSRIVIEDECMFLPAGEVWFADVTKGHTQFNSSALERVHLVISFKHKDWKSNFEKDSNRIVKYDY